MSLDAFPSRLYNNEVLVSRDGKHMAIQNFTVHGKWTGAGVHSYRCRQCYMPVQTEN